MRVPCAEDSGFGKNTHHFDQGVSGIDKEGMATIRERKGRGTLAFSSLDAEGGCLHPSSCGMHLVPGN